MSGVSHPPGDGAVLWAANPSVFQSVEFLVTVGLLVLVLLGGAVVLYFTDVWRKRQLAPDRESAESLTSYRAMYERGEITEAEYELVRTRLAAQLRQEARAVRPAHSAGPQSGAEAAPELDGRPPERPLDPPTG
jgi:hypothetical protein